MTESGDSTDEDNVDSILDLSSLNNLDFGPNWAVGGGKQAPRQEWSGKQRPRQGSGKPRRGDGAHPDRRSGRRTDRRRDGSQGNDRRAQPYQPAFDVQLQPDGTAFSALAKAMRDSCRTYELFELARLFLAKPDRFVAKVFPKKEAAEASRLFHISVPDGVGFESEDEALTHVVANHLKKFFEVEEMETEPPKGTFNVINRCPMTGVLIGPPNYHRYPHILQEHFAEKINNMPMERYVSRIETVSDKELIDAWLESMKKSFQYKSKFDGQVFNHLEEARRHLLTNQKEKVVRASDHCRLHGRNLSGMPANRIRRSVEAVLEQQLQFPLDFSNYLRGRLRRINFTIYKRGGKGGITYVCAVKRQYRTPQTVFSDSIQSVITFLEDNQDVTAQHFLQSQDDKTQDTVATDENTQEEPVPETEPQWNGTKPTSPSLRQDLRWLVQAGFVTEYSDGRLFAPPVREAVPPTNQTRASKPKANEANDDGGKQETVEPAEPSQTNEEE